ncbi:MAG: hypothetical protein WCD04_18815 [Terriglobia bacterium]|jgi:hypothetical protein
MVRIENPEYAAQLGLSGRGWAVASFTSPSVRSSLEGLLKPYGDER